MTPQLRNAVNGTILDACCSLELPEPWDFVAEYVDAVGAVEDPDDLCHRLLNEFGLELLASIGISLECADGTLELPDDLTGEIFLPLQDRFSQSCFEIVVDEGCLSGRSIPVFAATSDANTSLWTGSTGGQLFATGSLMDASLLRALGIPAITSSGLASPDLQRIEQLRHRFRVSSPAYPSFQNFESSPLLTYAADLRAAKTELSACSRLTVVAWSVSQCSRQMSPQTEELLLYLCKLSANLGMDFSKIELWQPGSAGMSQINWAISWQNPDVLRAVLLRSINDSSISFAQWLVENAPDPADDVDYPTAYAKLLEELKETKEVARRSDRIKSARAIHSKVVDRELIQPLIEDADQTFDAADRVLKLQMAELSRMFFAKCPELLVGTSDSTSLAAVRTQLAIANATANLKKQLG